MFYELYVQPESGPCTVHERGPKGETCSDSLAEAIRWAKDKRRCHRNMNFVVHAVEHNTSREVVYRTLDDVELQEETRS